VESWKRNRTSQHSSDAQLQWEAHVVEYVNFLWAQTKNRTMETQSSYLSKDIPLLGPRFVPPSHQQLEKRQYTITVSPTTAYIKPINIVHPFYYPTLTNCPKCKSTNTLWEGWTGTGAREVHGLYLEETALGFQLRCKTCEKRTTEGRNSFCYATTNPIFWQDCEHWQVPRQSFLHSENMYDKLTSGSRWDPSLLQKMRNHTGVARPRDRDAAIVNVGRDCREY
jgi:hypothetical protein